MCGNHYYIKISSTHQLLLFKPVTKKSSEARICCGELYAPRLDRFPRDISVRILAFSNIKLSVCAQHWLSRAGPWFPDGCSYRRHYRLRKRTTTSLRDITPKWNVHNSKGLGAVALPYFCFLIFLFDSSSCRIVFILSSFFLLPVSG